MAILANGKATAAGKPSYEELLAQVEALKKAQQASIKLKVSEKGAVSLYGLGRFPISLYVSQWERVLDAAEDIRAFLEANKDRLSTKD
jgi:hypothetical protein